MRHRSSTPHRLARFFAVAVLLFLLLVMNRQFINGIHIVENLTEQADSLAKRWHQMHVASLFDDQTPRLFQQYLSQAGKDTASWLQTSRIHTLGGLPGIELSFDDVNSHLSRITMNDSQSASSEEMEKLAMAIDDMSMEMARYRRRLDGGYSYLVQAQVILIILMAVLLVIAMEDRSQRRIEIAKSLQLHDEVARAQEEERNRIALDLHDDVAQELSWLRMDLSKTESLSERIRVIDHLLSRIRELSQSLRAPDFAVEGFDDAIRDLVDTVERRSGFTVTYLPGTRSPGDHPDIYGHLYRIIQECLSNAVRHANPKRVFIEIQEENGSVYLEYRDDGRGFHVASGEAKGHFGLRGIRNRTLMCRGESSILSNPGQGTVVKCRLPLEASPHV